MNQHSLAHDIQQATAHVHSDEPSTTNWALVEALLAEALHLGEGAVYAATVSKPGNLTVRMSQSDTARDAEVFVAMYTGDTSVIESCVNSAVKKAKTQGRLLVLIFVDRGTGIALEAGVKQATDPVPSPLVQAYPSATWVDC
jgi:hypothetical protein